MYAASPKSGFYVYAYLRVDGTPYYIGKGQRDRAFHSSHTARLPADKSRIVFVATGMSQNDALCLEMLLVFLHGRKDNGTGILRNRTDGGDGCTGHIPSADTRMKRSLALRGRKRSAEFGRKISAAKKGRTFITEEHRSAISRALKGKSIREEHRQRISAAKLACPTRHIGASNGRAILSAADVREIRTGSLKEHEAKQRWGISRTQFYRIKRGEQWTTA